MPGNPDVVSSQHHSTTVPMTPSPRHPSIEPACLAARSLAAHPHPHIPSIHPSTFPPLPLLTGTSSSASVAPPNQTETSYNSTATDFLELDIHASNNWEAPTQLKAEPRRRVAAAAEWRLRSRTRTLLWPRSRPGLAHQKDCDNDREIVCRREGDLVRRQQVAAFRRLYGKWRDLRKMASRCGPHRARRRPRDARRI
jgi:hypothetical protein